MGQNGMCKCDLYADYDLLIDYPNISESINKILEHGNFQAGKGRKI